MFPIGIVLSHLPGRCSPLRCFRPPPRQMFPIGMVLCRLPGRCSQIGIVLGHLPGRCSPLGLFATSPADVPQLGLFWAASPANVPPFFPPQLGTAWLKEKVPKFWGTTSDWGLQEEERGKVFSPLFFYFIFSVQRMESVWIGANFPSGICNPLTYITA